MKSASTCDSPSFFSINSKDDSCDVHQRPPSCGLVVCQFEHGMPSDSRWKDSIDKAQEEALRGREDHVMTAPRVCVLCT